MQSAGSPEDAATTARAAPGLGAIPTASGFPPSPGGQPGTTVKTSLYALVVTEAEDCRKKTCLAKMFKCHTCKLILCPSLKTRTFFFF